VLLATYDSRGGVEPLAAAALTPGTRARAKAVAGTIRTDGATVAAELMLQATSDRS
jgi:vancomycin aglycone glucosyltransferase